MSNKIPDSQMKARRMVVETKGDYMLNDVSTEQVVEPHRPSVVIKSTFIDQRVANGQLEVIEPSTELTDAELEKQWRSGEYDRGSKPYKEPPQAIGEGAPVPPSEAPPPLKPAPEPTNASPREQGTNESDDDYIAYLEGWEKDNKKV